MRAPLHALHVPYCKATSKAKTLSPQFTTVWSDAPSFRCHYALPSRPLAVLTSLLLLTQKQSPFARENAVLKKADRCSGGNEVMILVSLWGVREGNEYTGALPKQSMVSDRQIHTLSIVHLPRTFCVASVQFCFVDFAAKSKSNSGHFGFFRFCRFEILMKSELMTITR